MAVDRTEINVYPVRLVGAPEAMNFANMRLLNVTHSAASFVQTDDIEAFVREPEGAALRGTRMGRHFARPRRRGAGPRAQRDPRLGDARDGGAGAVQGVGRLYARGLVMDAAAARARRRRRRRIAPRSRRSSMPRRGSSMPGGSATGWRCSPRTAPIGCPPAPDQKSPFDHVSLFYDDRDLMKTRIDRLEHPRIHIQTPPSRTAHLVGNVIGRGRRRREGPICRGIDRDHGGISRRPAAHFRRPTDAHAAPRRR